MDADALLSPGRAGIGSYREGTPSSLLRRCSRGTSCAFLLYSCILNSSLRVLPQELHHRLVDLVSDGWAPEWAEVAAEDLELRAWLLLPRPLVLGVVSVDQKIFRIIPFAPRGLSRWGALSPPLLQGALHDLVCTVEEIVEEALEACMGRATLNANPLHHTPGVPTRNSSKATLGFVLRLH
eukprot:CAMPEP_0206527510 /NCGR_PEP_ID=MMETSP0325_2-20121206/1387_1 /ASSEMBLY_ACC=CAM_ASM_000347 /TAXON_ID=2866 /ORGANISM="Crypthecodinium cohnii, Strain Seligo" /LENGTH=180 /DNA_ID=CAMNT_0054022925 /DNA_START=117 /DNA_END=659 /DNA_ORIENTATION=+